MTVTKEDFYNIDWNEYGQIAVKLARNIKEYCLKHEREIHYIVPILRGGGILGIHLSHMLDIVQIRPCQYKYTLVNNDYIPVEFLEPNLALDYGLKPVNILVTEGNHCSGITAQKCIDKIHQFLPDASIIYACLARDASYLKPLTGTVYEVYGILSNESKKLSADQCKKIGIPNKFSVFPWELVEEEIKEINNSTSNY